MVQVIEQFDPFGKLGEGLGKGLQEGMTQGAQNARLSAGLERLKSLPAGSQPLDWMQTLARSGMTQEQMAMAMPLIREQMARQDVQRAAKPGLDVPSAAGQERPESVKAIPLTGPVGGEQKSKVDVINPATATWEDYYKFEPKSSLTVGELKHKMGARPEWSPERFDVERAKVQNQFPSYTPEQVENRAQKNLERTQAIYDEKSRQISVREKAEEDYRTAAPLSIAKYLQSDDLKSAWNEVNARDQQQLIDKFLPSVSSGDKSATQVAEQLGQVALDIANARVELKKKGETGWLHIGKHEFGPTTGTELKNMANTMLPLANLGLRETIYNDYQNVSGISAPKASFLAKPMNPDLMKEYEKLPFAKQQHVQPFGIPGLVGMVPSTKLDDKTVKEFVDNVINKRLLTPDDPILGVAYAIKQKGGDENIWYDAIDDAVKNRKIVLDQFQQEELGNRQPVKPTPMDKWTGDADNISWYKIMKRLFFGRD